MEPVFYMSIYMADILKKMRQIAIKKAKYAIVSRSRMWYY